MWCLIKCDTEPLLYCGLSNIGVAQVTFLIANSMPHWLSSGAFFLAHKCEYMDKQRCEGNVTNVGTEANNSPERATTTYLLII